MKTIAEIEEDPIAFVEWAKAQIAAEHAGDPEGRWEYLKRKEDESRARGVKFVNFSTSSGAEVSEGSCIVREDPPAKEAE